MRSIGAIFAVLVCLISASSFSAERTRVASLSTGQFTPIPVKHSHERVADITCQSKDGSHTCSCQKKCVTADNDCRCED